jgi:predicted ATPase
MGIQRLNISGFRSLRDVEWAPGRLNVLIGPNASGKSNLLRALVLLQKSAHGKLPEEMLRMGGIAPVLWDGQARTISWALCMEQGMRYELQLRQLGNTSAYIVNHEALTSQRAESGRDEHVPRGTGEQESVLARDAVRAVTFDREGRSVTVEETSLPGNQTLLSLVGTPFGHPAAFDFCSTLGGWTIYHDVRVDPDAPLRQAAVARVERRIAADGQNLVPVLHTLYTGERDFRKTVDDAMRAAFGDDYEELLFPPAADQRVQMRVRWRSLRSEQPAADLSDGTIRFLLLVAMLSTPSPGDLIAIDEPETGLHPSMLPVVAELARAASERTQVILTTHSPQLLDAFGNEPPTVTVTGRADGQTTLSVVDDQELRRWLEEYSLGALHRSGELEAMV